MKNLWRLASLALIAACASGVAKPTAPAGADAAVQADAGAQADAAADAWTGPRDFHKPGPYGVGATTVTALDATRQRTVAMTLWYPTTPLGTVEGFAPAQYYAAAQLAVLQGLYPKAAPGCTTEVTHAGAAGVLAGKVPLVAFSHCSGCFRTSSFSLAEALASHGIAVIAPDHPPNTLFDKQTGAFEGLTQAMVAARVADIRFALDVALDPTSTALPASLRGKLDPQRVGVFGHSFGGITAGKVLVEDPRVQAALAIAVPLAHPAVPGVEMEAIHKPVFLLLAKEDNSISELGNGWIRDNFAAANGPAWLVEVADAGHFSFSDIAGLTADFAAGCGAGKRQTDGTDFTYLDNLRARQIAQFYVTAFFSRFLLGDPAAQLALDATPTDAAATVQAKAK